MRILVVNDDGFDSIGINLLAKALQKYGDVTIVAPDSGRSASSHAVILHKPITVKKVDSDIETYKISGKPADCVRLGVNILEKFDIIFSGVNNGLNLGTDILYSGTTQAALEANILGYPSVAISCDLDFDIVKKELDMVLDYIFTNNIISKDYTLNINFPTNAHHKSKGIKFAVQGNKVFYTNFHLVAEDTYNTLSEEVVHDTNPESDVYLADKGYITMTMLNVYQDNKIAYNKLKENNK